MVPLLCVKRSAIEFEGSLVQTVLRDLVISELTFPTAVPAWISVAAKKFRAKQISCKNDKNQK